MSTRRVEPRMRKLQKCVLSLVVSLTALFSLTAFPGAALAQDTALEKKDKKSGTRKGLIVDRVVAVVNDEVILSTELMMRVAPAAYELNNISDVKERTRRQNKLATKVLDEMINEVLVSQAARKANLEISAKEVEAAITDLKKQNGLDDEQLQEALKMQGYTMSSYRKDVKSQILRLRAVNSLVRSRVKIGEDDIRAKYEENARRSAQVSEVRLQHILLALPSSASDEEKAAARKKASDLLMQAKGGADFATLAQAHSDDPGTKNIGGDLGWIARGTIASEWEDVVFAMNKGETRGPIQGPQGLHLFHVADQKSSKQDTFENSKEKLRNELYRVELDKQTRLWVEELRKNAHFEVLL